VKISQHVKFGNRALPYFHRNRLIQMAAEVDEVPGAKMFCDSFFI